LVAIWILYRHKTAKTTTGCLGGRYYQKKTAE
jgi:hypothetical protein